MTYKTHALAGLCAGLYISTQGTYDPLSVIGLSAIGFVGGLFPDIDLPNSRIGQAARLPSRAAFVLTGHRGFFHGPIVYILGYLLLIHFIPQQRLIWDTFLIGCATHLFLDLFNKAGIPLLFPWKKKFNLMSAKLDGFMEKFTRFVLMTFSTICVVALFRT